MNTNLFYLDLNTWLGLVLLLLIIGLALLLFFMKSYKISSLLLIFTGFLLIFNEINIIIALIPFIFGVVIAFMES